MNFYRDFFRMTLHTITIMSTFFLKGCLICCCAPIGNFMLAEKMGLDGFQYKYLSLLDYVGGGGIFSFISAMLLRQKVRERYGIDGSNGSDCITAFFCTTCSICQMTKQVDEEK